MTAHYLKDGEKILKSAVSRPITATDNYFAHFLGPYGAKKFLAALTATPDAIGATMFPAAAKSNTVIFYNGNQPRTLTQIYQLVQDRINNKVKSFGITPSDMVALGAGTNAGSASPTDAGTTKFDEVIKRKQEGTAPASGAAPSSPERPSRNLVTTAPNAPAQSAPMPIDGAPRSEANLPQAPQPDMSTSMSRAGSANNSLGAEAFTATNKILSDQLIAQTNLVGLQTLALEALKALVSFATNGAGAGASDTTKPPANPTPKLAPLELPATNVGKRRMT